MTLTITEDNNWPDKPKRNAGRKPNAEHDALAKRLTDGASIRIDSDDPAKLNRTLRNAMLKRGLKVDSQVTDTAVYLRIKA